MNLLDMIINNNKKAKNHTVIPKTTVKFTLSERLKLSKLAGKQKKEYLKELDDKYYPKY